MEGSVKIENPSKIFVSKNESVEAIGQKVETLHQTGFSGTTAELVGAGKVDGGFELIISNLQAMENGLFENDFTTGTVEGNVEILKTLNYTSSYEKGKATFVDAVRELKELGVLKPDTDVDAFIKRGYVDIEGIPEGYIYDAEKKEFLEIGKEI